MHEHSNTFPIFDRKSTLHSGLIDLEPRNACFELKPAFSLPGPAAKIKRPQGTKRARLSLHVVSRRLDIIRRFTQFIVSGRDAAGG